ncbi:hypothetical protein ACFL4X_02670, partial [Gemmatimonadota bacterium]
RGVGVAVIDQPLLKGHREYTGALLRYDASGLKGVSVQMHGAPVASVAVGREVGVAPQAALTYFAVATWKKDNQCYIDAMEKIFHMNRTLPDEEKVRVVSISTGMFRHIKNFEQWQEVTRRADSLGITIITCQMDSLNYGTATATPGQDPDDPASYARGRYAGPNQELLVPTGNTTVASHRGIEDYTFYRQGGMSWAAPYIAGVAAMAYQVDPDIKPARIISLLKSTANRTEAGQVINPMGFIEEVEKAMLAAN